MSVMIVTSLGDIVVDLHTGNCPLTSKNFLKLCKIKYYNGCLFHTVQKDFIAQTGDPTGTGSGGDSVYKYLYGDQARFFKDEIHVDLKHSKMGTIAMASAGENLNASQFYITLRDDLDYLDGKHTVFGEVAEGLETLTRINEAYVDDKNRPFKNIRIKHTYILDDPFEDPRQLAELIPDASPEGKPKDEVDDEVRLEDDWVPLDEQLGAAELEEVLRENEAHTRAVVLESVGDIPDAEVKPPDNVLFVCKLNPVTEDEDLHTIFSRFGNVTSADIIRDFKTGDSLCYAFIEFDDKDACERAYFKMDNALIDDRRIHVDFSQSVSKLWNQYRRKGNHKGGEKGCFKCGAPDHMAKECTGDPALKSQPAKYVLKDNNMQRGGADNSRFEMVFDEEGEVSLKHKDKHGHHDKDDRIHAQKAHHGADDIKYRERETDKPRESHRYRGHKQEGRHEIRENRYPKEESDRKKERGYERRDNKYPIRSDDDRSDGGYRRKMENEDRTVGRKEGRDGRRSIDDDGGRQELEDGKYYKRRRAEDDRRDEPAEGKNDTYRRRREVNDGRRRASEERDRDRRYSSEKRR